MYPHEINRQFFNARPKPYPAATAETRLAASVGTVPELTNPQISTLESPGKAMSPVCLQYQIVIARRRNRGDSALDAAVAVPVFLPVSPGDGASVCFSATATLPSLFKASEWYCPAETAITPLRAWLGTVP